MWTWLFLAIAIPVIGAAAAAHGRYRRERAEAEGAMAALAARAQAPRGSFDPAMIADLPEVAQRYFAHAIAPGTPLRTTVRLDMRGSFLLGRRDSYQTYALEARQVLAPPAEFVWMPRMRSGVLRISGSDALVQGHGWTRFWMNGLVPVVAAQGSPDLDRSALTRAAMEAIWAPASLLPAHGAVWEQTGPDSARIGFATGVEPMHLTLGPDGRVVEIQAMRWSHENPERRFRLQPFGGTVEAEARFHGFTIPSRVRIGNHFGTADYLPFFQVEITRADYS